MQTLLDAIRNALYLVVTLDANVIEYSERSLVISSVATCLAGLLGIPAGVVVATYDFPGKRVLVTLLNTLLSVPTVVVGLLVYSLISRNGPLGQAQLLFTVPGIIVGEVLLILPLVTAFTVTAVTRTDRDVRRTAIALGASTRQAHWLVLCESRFGVLAALIAAFGRVVSEVGVAMILGGNIDHFTRTLTTAVVLNVDTGDFALALALGFALLVISLGINVLLQFVQGGGRE
jgi:tungstate transport system permease protein